MKGWDYWAVKRTRAGASSDFLLGKEWARQLLALMKTPEYRNQAFLSKVADDQAKRPSTGHIALGFWSAIEHVLIGLAGMVDTNPNHAYWSRWSHEKRKKAS